MSKPCPPGKMVNPATNRCVLIDGKIGQALLQNKNKSKSENKSKSASPKATKPTKDAKGAKGKTARQFTATEIRRMKNEIHPDSKISKDSVELLKTVQLTENKMYDVIDLAGYHCRFVHKTLTISLDDVNKELAIVRKGPKAIQKERARLNVLASAFIKEFNEKHEH